MVKSGTVNSDSSIYDGYLKSCKSKFDGLEGDWKGPSREKLTASVDAFIGEADVVKSQLSQLASVCQNYESYEDKAKKCDEKIAEYETEERKGHKDEDGYWVHDSDPEVLGGLSGQIKQLLTDMRELNSQAQSTLSGISETVNEVEIGPTEYQSGSAVV